MQARTHFLATRKTDAHPEIKLLLQELRLKLFVWKTGSSEQSDFFPPRFLSLRKLLSYARGMQVHPRQSSHMIRNLFARERGSFPLSEAALVGGRQGERKWFFFFLLGDTAGIKAS